MQFLTNNILKKSVIFLIAIIAIVTPLIQKLFQSNNSSDVAGDTGLHNPYIAHADVVGGGGGEPGSEGTGCGSCDVGSGGSDGCC